MRYGSSLVTLSCSERLQQALANHAISSHLPNRYCRAVAVLVARQQYLRKRKVSILRP